MALLILELTGCIGINLPNGGNNSDKDNTTETSTDSDDSPPPDDTDTTTTTTLPAQCDLEEVEPNNTVEEQQLLPTELWACGVFGVYLDPDFLNFTSVDGGWMQLEVEAAERGSAADVQVTLSNDDTSVTMFDGYLSSDPNIVFPMSAGESFRAVLGEHTYLFGDAYFWYARASQIKPPVEWDREEVEDNSGFETAEPFTDGERVFGTIGEAGDFDWFVWTPPEGATSVRYQIRSGSYNSPTNITLLLSDDQFEDLDGDGDLDLDEFPLDSQYDGVNAYDPDPLLEVRFTEADPAAPRYIQLKDANGFGSRFAWYVLEITSSYE